MIGEHTREILEMIGRTGAEIDGLFASGTAVQRDLPR
jgi:ribulose kinase